MYMYKYSQSLVVRYYRGNTMEFTTTVITDITNKLISFSTLIRSLFLDLSEINQVSKIMIFGFNSWPVQHPYFDRD